MNNETGTYMNLTQISHFVLSSTQSSDVGTTDHIESACYVTINSFINSTKEPRLPSFYKTEIFKWLRLAASIGATIFNLAFLIGNLINGKNKHGILKVRLLILLYFLILTIWSITSSAIYCFDVLIFYSSDFEEMWNQTQEDEDLSSVWMAFLDGFVQPLIDSQALLIFAISLDRYLSLFSVYWPFVESRKILVSLLLIPLIICFVIFNPALLKLCLPFPSFLYCRLALFLLPSLLSFLLLSVCLLSKREKINYDPGFSISLSKSLVRVLFVIVLVDVISRTLFTFRFIEDNLDFIVLTGSEAGDALIQIVFDVGLQVSLWIFVCSPIYTPIIFSSFIKHFRDAVFSCCQRTPTIRTI
ncbi:unnamed protein product [Caenorhabditis bovis]|uniref:G-protein coupled receptors family 1 profile domain-containing protein n=1 Tax=Caenorhabditis bovis TaxID=2654633 RepID=A0A8S1FFI4_9PELO|nr:unnamed protein product [Caenorhabditis bovis]